MTDARINAFIGGVIGGFAAVGVTNIALQVLRHYQRREAREQRAHGVTRIGGGES
jgi:hypothetical protein